VPVDLDRPYLEDDPHFDVDNHIHRIAVPSPGSMRELGELTGHLYAQHLDRRKPLWEMWFIEGVEGGKVALFVKTHHCLIDGASGAGLGEMLFDMQPDPPPRAPAPKPARSSPEPQPSDWVLAARGLASAMLTPSRLTRYGFQLARQLGVMLPYLRASSMPSFGSVPQVSFNAPIGPRRALACASVPLGDVRELKKHFDVKLNDVVLELTASAVRRYLKARKELPKDSLAVAIAVSTRAEGDATLGNQVTTIFVSWATDIEDPAERLRKIHENVSKAKEMERALRATEIQAIGDTAPPRWINLAWRALLAAGVPAPSNLMVSNVPGPPFPLYTAGARIECMYPMSILAPGNGINVTVISYRGRIDFGFTVDPELVPDPWQLAEGIPIALEDLKRRAGLT
jgi:WS/DGAT/MGAT family acyltransferase